MECKPGMFFALLALPVLAATAWCTACTVQQDAPLTVFAGAASQPALKKIARQFEQRTGTRVELVFSAARRMHTMPKEAA